jgi:hypothetical protein
MFAAVEGPAEERPPLVNRASGGAEIDAGAVLFGGKKINRISGDLIGTDLKLVRLHIVALLGVQKEALIAPAAFRAGTTGDLG